MAANNQQPSFKTNVNRMKTKRWVEAKSYSYDGDDWGEADEYDEYDGYDEPAPAPAASSSRQPMAGYPQDPRQHAAPFPGAPPQPAYMQQQPRSGSPGRPSFAQDPRDRSGSFDRGDERRNFSGPAAPGSPTVAPLRTAYGAAPRNQSPMGRGQPRTPASPPYAQPGFAGGRPSAEYQTRGASGPLPPPGAPFAGPDASARTWSMGSQGSIALARRDQPPAPSQGQQPPGETRPPRKSSLGQASAPSIALLQQSARPEPEADSELGSAPAASSGVDSPPPRIIRPADIYKRVAEEKERERMSQESGRPSMSEIIRDKDNETADGSTAVLRPRKATLDTVAERKSEYGLDGLASKDQIPVQQGHRLAAADMTEEERKRISTSPQLPDFESGFGDDWMSGFGPPAPQPANLAATQQQAQAAPTAREADVAQGASGLGLSHKPSEGFRSVVHQAFDEPVVANTPAGSDVVRSDTTSTNAISPIVSRNSSKDQPKGTELRAVNMGAIAEEGNIGAPHENGRQSIPKQIDGKAQPTDDLPPPGFVPGHRRDTSIPSPGNSPARQPKLEVRNVPQDGAGAEFAAVTPNEERESRQRAASAAKASQIQNVVETLAQQARDGSLAQTSPNRAESPTKGRVRDLVGKAESASSSRRGSESSQTGGLRPSQDRTDSFRPQLPGGWNSYVTNPMSPSPERGISPQPEPTKSPSSGISPDVQPSSLPGAAVNPTLLGQGGASPTIDSAGANVATDGLDIEPTTRKRSLAQGEASDSIDPVRDPLTAAKAAGAALAGAVTAVTGLDGGKSIEPTADQWGTPRGQHGFEKGGTTLHPESARPAMPPSVDSTATSILQTPQGYSPNRTSEVPSEEDIPAVAPLRQKPLGATSPVTSPAAPGAGDFSPTQLPSLAGTSRDTSMDEHDRHMRDIVRQLTPNPPGSEPPTSHPSTPTPPQAFPTIQQPPVHQPPPSNGPAPQAARPAKAKTLKHKFSWEADSEEESETPAPAPRAAPPPQQFTVAAPVTPQSSVPIITPSQTITTVKSSPVPELDSSPSTFQHGFMSPAAPAPKIEEPAALELPALRTSSDAGDSRQVSELSVGTSPKADRPSVDEEQLKSPPPPAVPSKNDVSPMSPIDDSRSVEHQQFQPPSQGARQRGQTLSGTQGQVPAFREILAMKSPEDRLRVYRTTQETFSNMNTGLSNWIQVMGEKHPEHRPLLQTAGNFSAPTPGLPAAPRPQAGASATSGSGSGFSGLRKAGAAAAPSMGDAGAALKSAGRDTKKLAKGLFAKGRSKFGRDKGSSKLASVTKAPQQYQPYRPGAAPSPQAASQAQYVPYRSGQQATAQAIPHPVPTGLRQAQAAGVRAIPAPDPAPGTAPAPAPGPIPHPPRHAANQKSLPDIPLDSPAASVAPRPSDVSDIAHSSVDEDLMGDIIIALPPVPDSPPQAKSPLRQRLTIHQKDITPFEVNFPKDLLDSDAFKAHNASEEGSFPVPPSLDTAKPGTPREEEAIPDQPTPRRARFPKRTQSLSAGRTLDPGIEIFNTTPSWLNWDPASSPATSDFFGLSSPSNKSTKSSPSNVRSKRASLQISLQSPDQKMNMAARPIEEEGETTEGLAPADGTKDRPFSFINFGDQPDADLSLNEVKYKVPSRQSSVITESTEEYNPSRVSTHDDSLHDSISRDEELDEESSKPLPDLPNEVGEPQRIAHGGGQYATMPARQGPKVSLFPQSTSRPGTSERQQSIPHGDFGPPRMQNRPQQDISESMPVAGAKAPRHRRAFSGANLLQRALTAGINTLEGPKRDKNVVKAEKTDKKRRRFSGLNILGKPKPIRRVPIEDSTPPGTSRLQQTPMVGGFGDLATMASPLDNYPPRGQSMQRPNAPDPIHVAPIEGYYSPEGDATQSPAPLSSPIPSTHIASQYNSSAFGSLPRTSTMPAAITGQTTPTEMQKRALEPRQYDSRTNSSAFNESNDVVRQAMYNQQTQQHAAPRLSPQPQPQPFVPMQPHMPSPSRSPIQGPARQTGQVPWAQSKSPVIGPHTIAPPSERSEAASHTSPHPPPASGPPTAKLPQIPYVAQKLQREATLRQAPDSPHRPIDPEQLVPAVNPASISPSEHSLDRSSLEAFPRPPSKSSNASLSGLSPVHRSPASGFHQSPSPSASTAQWSRGPRLSVDTNLANSVSEGRRSRMSQTSQTQSQRRPSNVGLSAGPSGSQGNSNEASKNASSSNVALVGDTDAVPQPVHDTSGQATPYTEDDLPSGLSALHHSLARHAGESSPVAALVAPRALPHQHPRSPQGLGLKMPPSASSVADDSARTDKTQPDSADATATANKMTIQPATLRRMRQREIELGGETRLNSPMGPDETNEIAPMPRLDMVTAALVAEKSVQEPEAKKDVTEKDMKKDEKEDEVDRLPVPARTTEEASEEKIVMSATSFPGQEWNPYEEF